MLFALTGDAALGHAVSQAAGYELSGHEERDFEDGEHKTRALVSVRDRDVYVICSLYGAPGYSVNDKLCRLLFFLGSLRDAAAAHLTAIVPYLCYARKDRQTKPRDPVTTRYVAQLIEAVGVDRVVTLDVHNLAAFQNAFRVPTEHLEARWILAQHIMERVARRDVVVVSPDLGGAKRAQRFREALHRLLAVPVGTAFVEKYRSGGRIRGSFVVGDVTGRVAVVVDDLVSSGTTLVRAARGCMDAGAEAVHAVATHGIFSGDAGSVVASDALSSVTVTDAIPPAVRAAVHTAKVEVVPIAPLLAETIRRLHAGGSIVELVEEPRAS
jgi:ribose-phosphate pyrophosphokinase